MTRTDSLLCSQVLNEVYFAGIKMDPVVRALQAHLKTHRINVENVFESIQILWPSARFSVLEKKDEYYSAMKTAIEDTWTSEEDQKEFHEAERAHVGYEITFDDGSTGFAFSVNGIGMFYMSADE